MGTCKMMGNTVGTILIVSALAVAVSFSGHPASAGFFDDLEKSAKKIGDGLEEVGNEIQKTLEGEAARDPAPSASPKTNATTPAQTAPDNLNRDREKVRATQRMLNRLGYEAGTPDGLYGNRTRGEIIKFQNASGITPSGNVTPHLLRELEAQVEAVDTAREESVPASEHIETANANPDGNAAAPAATQSASNAPTEPLGKLILSSPGNASVPAFDLYYEHVKVGLTLPGSDRVETTQKMDRFAVVHDAGPDDVVVPFISKTVDGTTRVRYSDEFIRIVREEIAPAILKVKPRNPIHGQPGSWFDHYFRLFHFIKGHTELPTFELNRTNGQAALKDRKDLILTTAFISRQGWAFQTKEEWGTGIGKFSGKTDHYFPAYIETRRSPEFALSGYLHGEWNSDNSLLDDGSEPLIDTYTKAQAARRRNAQK